MAEWADLAPECEELLGDRLRRAVDDACPDHRLDSHIAVGVRGVRLQTDQAAGALEHLVEIAKCISVRALLAIHPLTRLRVRAGHMHVLDHTPVGSMRHTASLPAAFFIKLPVRGGGINRCQAARHRSPAARARNFGGRRARTRDCNTDRRPASAARLWHDANAEWLADRFLDREAPKLAVELIRRALRPDALDERDRLEHHALALAGVRNIEQLVVRRQAAGADTEDEATLAHVIELRDLRRDHGGMAVRQIDDAGCKRDALRLWDQTCHQHQGRRDRLAGGGEMLAQPHLVEAEPLGEQGLLGSLRKEGAKGPRGRMERHHEQAEAHFISIERWNIFAYSS